MRIFSNICQANLTIDHDQTKELFSNKLWSSRWCQTHSTELNRMPKCIYCSHLLIYIHTFQWPFPCSVFILYLTLYMDCTLSVTSIFTIQIMEKLQVTITCSIHTGNTWKCGYETHRWPRVPYEDIWRCTWTNKLILYYHQ